ncbi:5-formyltetrahydrofolate cyclo-ligase [Sandaracinobacter sp. RS1-74]|uniref:5-formyltetrahydrofolate cyclo-ligase n=1 Tax=Sandaracinobacteroides sayramensis TaxID=2913411 RepID=UPI001EDB8EA2|nr:5-formyltetrahydrofolate cyclo-ligase [Sandaracinobacteroides sayramensis]MCG2842412.1 5-formyltetrahydrofolate cyclo-ligase [Sandaracinobacteroides sayramensis]
MPEPTPLFPPPGADHSAETRKRLRQAARAARHAFAAGLNPLTRRALEQALCAQILPHLGPPGVLGSHAAIGDEIDPRAIEDAARASGWRLAFPRVGEGPLSYHRAGRADLAPGYKGIPEPPAEAPLARPDVLLVPLLAADLRGNRLGQGGGHYDRTLAALRASGPVLAIGIAFDLQLEAGIPAAPWDQPLDAIATPTAFHLTHGPARRAP